MVYVHRLSYEMHTGPIPDGLIIDHICRVPLCVNPAHLRAVTYRDNLMNSDTTYPPLKGLRTDHCPEGHLLQRRPDGRRRCMECARRKARDYQRQKRAQEQQPH